MSIFLTQRERIQKDIKEIEARIAYLESILASSLAFRKSREEQGLEIFQHEQKTAIQIISELLENKKEVLGFLQNLYNRNSENIQAQVPETFEKKEQSKQ